MLSERRGEEFLAKVSGVIERRLIESGIEGATIKRRVKSIYGIYRKTIMQNKSFDEIYDIYAVRVILDSWPSATAPWASSTICTTRCPTASRTISPPPSPTATRACTPRHRPRGHPLRGADPHPCHGRAGRVRRCRTLEVQGGPGGHDKLDERLAWVSQLLENQRVSEDSGNLLHDLKSDLLPRKCLPSPPRAM